MSEFTFVKPLTRVAAAFNRARIPYMVIGGQAVIHHGQPRFTKDIDFTLAVPPYELDRVLPLVVKLGLRPNVDDAQKFVDRTHVLPLFDENRSVRVDISFTDSPYKIQAIARGQDVVINRVPVRFASVEDLLIHKLVAGRVQDMIDVKTVLLKNPDADLDEGRHWLRLFAEALELRLMDRLDQAMRDAGM